MTAQLRLRVLLVDDHAMVRRGLAAFLKAFDDLELTGEAVDGADALRRCAEVLPDVVLMDLMMPEMDGVAAIRAIRLRFPTVRIIALTSFREEELVQRALQAGATGYLLKNVSADELVAAIRATHAGRRILAPEATQALIDAAAQPPVPGADLSVREREVLALLVRGLNNTAIAETLVVSRSTAKAHVSNILTKLGVSSRTEAVALAMRHHLIA
jgi:NarL family two-component system response regulator LiaR